jgi:hypothetical protein
MSGLEIAASVAGIISAFIAVGKAVRGFQSRRQDKLLSLQSTAISAESQFLDTVDGSPPRIQNQYDDGLSRAGPIFAKGDGTLFYVSRLLIGQKYHTAVWPQFCLR